MLITYDISSNPITRATQITSIVTDYAVEPHNNILKLSFNNHTMWAKIPMMADGTTCKRYKYHVQDDSNNAEAAHFKSNYLGVLSNDIAVVVADLVGAIILF